MLEEFKGNCKGLGGKGTLTTSILHELQSYYGISIRSNVGDLQTGKKGSHASLFHVASSDDNTWHGHCPDGKEGFMVCI